MSFACRICGIVLLLGGIGFFFYRILLAELPEAFLFAGADALFILLLFVVADLRDRVEVLEQKLSERDEKKKF